VSCIIYVLCNCLCDIPFLRKSVSSISAQCKVRDIFCRYEPKLSLPHNFPRRRQYQIPWGCFGNEVSRWRGTTFLLCVDFMRFQRNKKTKESLFGKYNSAFFKYSPNFGSVTPESWNFMIGVTLSILVFCFVVMYHKMQFCCNILCGG